MYVCLTCMNALILSHSASRAFVILKPYHTVPTNLTVLKLYITNKYVVYNLQDNNHNNLQSNTCIINVHTNQ